MRCEGCNYPLWNIPARQCPECGRSFLPSACEFLANSVRFCCPECDQPYYGTGARGQIEPIEFDCVRCGRHVHMDDMVLRPAEGLEEKETRVDRMPWLERRHGSRVKAWFTTIGRAMVSPARLMRSVPSDRTVGEAWWFATVTFAIITLCSGGLVFAVVGLVQLFRGSTDATGSFIASVSIIGGGTAALLLAIVLWGLVTHGILRVSGGASHSISRTYQALCYSAGANITTAVPCLGIYPFLWVGLLWWVVSAVLMVAEGQRVHGGRAALAVIVVPALTAFLALGGAFGLLFYGMSQAQTMAAAGAQFGQGAECRKVLEAVLADAEDGTWPVHGIELVAADALFASDLVGAYTATYIDDVPLGEITLADVTMMTGVEQRRAIAAVAAAQPADVVAHRVGDFVFTYHGIDPETADDELWIVIMSPDPAVHVEASALEVGKMSGEVEYIRSPRVDLELSLQNDLRRGAGLDPLPDPASIMDDEPYVGE